LLAQCFGNLLDNAAKFVSPGVRPRIRVWAGVGGDVGASEREASELTRSPRSTLPTPHVSSVRIWFEDNGIGIPEDAQEKIFRMFQRMHLESEYPGTGIGLAMVLKAVERMRGRVGLESEPGNGSKFWIELPDASQAENRTRLEHAA
jgi:signal transduction histidine kinase